MPNCWKSHATVQLLCIMRVTGILTDKRNATHFNCSRNIIYLIYFKTNFIILKSDYSLISIIDWNQISPSVSEWKRSTSHYPNYTFHKNQYLVKAPRLLITATHRRRIEVISLLIGTCGIRCHSSIKAARNWSNVLGCCWRLRTILSNWSHKCSIGDRSVDKAGQGNTSLSLCLR